MALNPALVGRTYPPSRPYVVGREKVREFAAAIGDGSSLSHDVEAARAAGFDDVVAPPTFAFSLAFAASLDAMQDPDLGLNYAMVVHGEQRFVYSRPIVAGDSLVATCSIEQVRAVAGNDLLTTRIDLATEDGDHVVTTYTVVVSRGTAEEGS